MAKSLCKYRRVEIAAQFSTISRIVSTANYMCSSCTRVASEKAYLCKPSASETPYRHGPCGETEPDIGRDGNSL